MGLDREGDRTIRDLWARLEQLGVPSLKAHVPSIRPHVSLAVTDDADGLRQHAPGLALRGIEIDIEMAAASLFPADPPLLVLAVAPSPELVALHARVDAGAGRGRSRRLAALPAGHLASSLHALDGGARRSGRRRVGRLPGLSVAGARPSPRCRSYRLRHRSDHAAVTRLTAYVSALVALEPGAVLGDRAAAAAAVRPGSDLTKVQSGLLLGAYSGAVLVTAAPARPPGRPRGHARAT